MKLLDAQGLLTELSKNKGTTFVRLETETIPEMRKGGNPFLDRIKVRQTHNILLGANYEDMVNRVREKEGKVPDFQAGNLKWGTHIPDTPFIFHTPKKSGVLTLYLMCNVRHSRTKRYYLKGVLSTDPFTLVRRKNLRAQIMSFMRYPYSSAPHQGVEEKHEVIIRTFKLESLRSMRFNRRLYLIDA
jgi:hypothetical protein